jgi:hypothetical protein
VTRQHPHVAHYDRPAGEAGAGPARRDAEAAALASRRAAREMDLGRWRALRYAVAIPLVCLSIAGGAVAVLAAVFAIGSSGGESVSMVTGVAADGTLITRTFAVSELYLIAGVLGALEIVLLWAAALLFAKRLHPLAWVVVLSLATVATAGLVWGMTAGGWSLATVNYPYALAFPVIMVASVLELLRVRWLRARWQGEPG